MSTSSSKVVARSMPMKISGEPYDSSSSSSISNITQAFPFSSGNPRIEETRGVMLLYCDDVISASPSVIPVGRKPLVCVIGVPNYMTYADFCQFYGSFIHHILEMRIAREKRTLKLKDDKIRALEEQLRDLIVYLEAGKTMEQLSMSDEIKGGTVLSIPTESSSRSGSKASNSRRS